jgi:hypothetical protein
MIGKRGRHRRKARKARKGGFHHRRTNVQRRQFRNPAYALKIIQKREGTTGLPPTAAEQRMARMLSKGLVFGKKGWGGTVAKPGLSAEESRRLHFVQRLAKEKREEAARRVAYMVKQREAAEAEARRKAAAEDAQKAIEAELANLK